MIVELPRVRYSLLLVNLYLRPGVGPTGGPNPQIIARLMPLLKQGANWIVAGDWNYPSPEMEETSLPENFRGKVVAPDEATISTGNCLDFAVASSRVAPLLQCSANWNVPFRPHAAVAFRLAISGGQVPLPQLSAFEGSLRPKEKDQKGTGIAAPSGRAPPPSSTSGERQEPTPGLGCFGRTWLASTPANDRFAHFTTSVAERHFTKPGGRGCARPIIHRPLYAAQGWPTVVWAGSCMVAKAAASLGASCGPFLPLPDPPFLLPGPDVSQHHPGTCQCRDCAPLPG